MPCGKDKPGGEANGRAEILRGLLCGQTLPALLRIFLLVLHQPSNPCKSADAKTASSSEVLVVPIRNQRFIFRSRLISLRSSQVHRSCEETLSEINFSCILPACDSQLLISCVMSFRYRCVCASSSALCSSRLSAVASVDILRYSSGWNRLASWEILKLQARVMQDGAALIPLSLYFKDSRVKVELGLCKGKKLHDKRDSAADREAKRDIDRAMKERNYQ